jgi:hypothetical protein
VRAAHPELDADDVIQRLIATARDRGAPGDDPIYGYGLLDAEAAVTADVPTVTSNPLGSLPDWVRLHRRAAATASPGARSGATPVAPAPTAVALPVLRDPVGVLLPSPTTLRLVGVPALVALLVLVVLAGLALGAARYFGSRRTR